MCCFTKLALDLRAGVCFELYYHQTLKLHYVTFFEYLFPRNVFHNLSYYGEVLLARSVTQTHCNAQAAVQRDSLSDSFRGYVSSYSF